MPSMKWRCAVGDYTIIIEAWSWEEARELAEEEALEGHMPGRRTFWQTYDLQLLDDDGEPVGHSEHGRVAIEPNEPQCTDANEHDWDEVSVQGHGGGVITTERCQHCDLERYTNTWDYDRTDGVQGLLSVEYAEYEDVM